MMSSSSILQNFIWIFSAASFVYFGDGKFNLVSIFFWDQRINRLSLYLGIAALLLNAALILHTFLKLSRSDEDHEDQENTAMHFAAESVLIIGVLSFFSVSYALWPVWNFLSIPLLLTLFMASMVILSYLQSRKLRVQVIVYTDNNNQTDCFSLEKPCRGDLNKLMILI